jgi:hypothetical protein
VARVRLQPLGLVGLEFVQQAVGEGVLTGMTVPNDRRAARSLRVATRI